MQVEQGTKHPEAGPWHKFTQMFTVVIGYPRNYQIRVIKLTRGSKILKLVSQVSNVAHWPLVFALTLAYHILHKSLSTCEDVSRTFIIPIRHWPLTSRSIFRAFYMALSSGHSFLAFEGHTISDSHEYITIILWWCVTYIKDICMNLTFVLISKLYFHHEFVSGQDFTIFALWHTHIKFVTWVYHH